MIKNNYSLLVFCVAIALSIAAPAQQSLGDLVREQNATESDKPKAKRVFSNDDEGFSEVQKSKEPVSQPRTRTQTDVSGPYPDRTAMRIKELEVQIRKLELDLAQLNSELKSKQQQDRTARIMQDPIKRSEEIETLRVKIASTQKELTQAKKEKLEVSEEAARAYRIKRLGVLR